MQKCISPHGTYLYMHPDGLSIANIVDRGRTQSNHELYSLYVSYYNQSCISDTLDPLVGSNGAGRLRINQQDQRLTCKDYIHVQVLCQV